jgi:hypothetical protein
MSDPFPPPEPTEPEPGGASAAGSSPPPDPYQGAGTAGGGSSTPAGEPGYPPPAAQDDPWAISGAQGGSGTPGGQPQYTNPAQSAGPPSAQQPSKAPPSWNTTSSMSGNDVQTAFKNANRMDLGIIAAGVLAFFFSLFSYYTVSVKGVNIGSSSGWHGFFSWFGVLLALAGAVLMVLPLLGVRLGIPTRLAALIAFAAATFCTLLALVVDPGIGGGFVDVGRGFGYWATLVMVIAGLVLCVMRKDAVD